MGKDTTAFRERFNAYKNGKSVSEIYDAGLPRYNRGKKSVVDSLDEEQLDTLHHIHDYFSNLGMSRQDIAGIAANMFKESSFRHNAKDSSGYHGYVQMSPDMQTAVKAVYGNLDPDTQLQFVYDQITGNSKVKGYTNGRGYKYGQYKTGGDAAEAFRSTFERNKAGRQQSRIDYGDQFYDYFNQRALQQTIGEQPKPIILQPVSTAVRTTIPQEQTKARWDGAEQVSPYITGKPIVKLMPRLQLPNLVELMEDSEWEPGFPGLKNGKLPGYKIGHNVSNAKLNEDGTFTDDYTKMFEDMYVTPQKTDLKRGSYTLNNFPYYLQHRSDWTKPFMSSGTNETGLELVNPEFDILLGGRQLATEIFKPFSKNANEIAKELNRGIEQNTILRNYNKVPANKDIGSAYDYLDFLDNIYPNSKINGVFYHGGPKGIQKFKSAKELGSTNKNINSGTKNYGIYFADDERLGQYYAQGFKKQNREVYNVRVNAESPIRYETDNWYLDKFVGNEDLRFRPGSITDKWYDKLDLKTKDAIYHTKSRNSFENGELVVFDGDNIHIMGTPKESQMFRQWKQNPIYTHKPIQDQIPLLPQQYDKSLKNYAKASVPGLFLGGIPIPPYLLYLYDKNRRKRYKQDDDVKPTTLKSKQITK